MTLLKMNAQEMIRKNERNLELCKAFGCGYILIDDEYNIRT